MTRALTLAAILLGLTFLIVWLAGGNAGALNSTDGQASVAYSLLLLAVILTSVVLNWRGTISQAATYSVVWGALFLFLILGYTYKDDFNAMWSRLRGEINPALAQERSTGELILRKADDGHFYVDVEVNGKLIRMLADTGATSITLSETDARSAGINTEGLVHNRIVNTANGQTAAARVTIDEIRIGSIVRRNVGADISRTMDGSLLGMSFFSTLSRFEISGNKLVLVD